MSCACSRSSARLSQPECWPTASRRVSSRLWARPSVGTAPRPSRSSGTKCSPSLRRWAGLMPPRSWVLPRALVGTIACAWVDTLISTVPEGARGSSPDSARSSSPCPLPDTPAMPTTSPERTSRPMCARSVPKGSARFRLRLWTLSTAGPALSSRSSSAGGSEPIIRRLSEALLSSLGLHTPVTWPPRSTVQAVHSSRISCNLWLM